MKTLFRNLLRVRSTSPAASFKAKQEIQTTECAAPSPGFVPPGHYYSPIPDWRQIQLDSDRIFRSQGKTLPGLNMNEGGQLALLDELSTYYSDMPFKAEKSDNLRYYFNNPSYSYCDAIFLYSMLRHLKPKRFVEIGSGFSSCIALDTNDLFLDGKMEMTFIEPFPEVLHSLIREEDGNKAAILQHRLQDIDLYPFDQLEAGDILFIDSTHVSKIDSDVNRIVFEILPRLASGVYIHFHDVFYPFEYPKTWVDNGQAWNEIYILRAFLEYNERFSIELMSTFLTQFHRDRFEQVMPLCLVNPGGDIWLKKH